MENAGTTVGAGKFLIFKDKFLGSGAFYEVYKGEQILTKMPVAIKVYDIERLQEKHPYLGPDFLQN